MYNPEEIRRLAKEYVRTGDTRIFEKLLTEQLSDIIDIQLAKKYKGLREYWGDIRQDILLQFWKWAVEGTAKGVNLRESLKKASTKDFYNFFYLRISTFLYYRVAELEKEYESLKTNVTFFDDLPMQWKTKFGIELEDKDWEFYGK